MPNRNLRRLYPWGLAGIGIVLSLLAGLAVTPGSLSIPTIAIGLALTALVAGIAAGEVRARSRIDAAVAARTREITEVNARLRREIEERQRAEALLLEREHRFRDFAEVASDWYWETDREHKFIYVSERIRDLGGFPPAYYIGKTREQTMMDLERPPGWSAHLADLAAHRPFRNFIITRRRQDGTQWFVQISGRPIFGPEGEFHGYRGTGQDVSDLKRRELELATAVLRNEMLNAAAAATASGIILTDETSPDSPVAYVNPAFTTITGYGADEALGRNCRFLQGADTDPAAVAQIRAAVAERRHASVEIRNYRKDGKPFWNELSLSPVFRPSGELVAFVGIINDVTAGKATVERLQRSQKMEVVGQLTGGVAHDFNNLLAVIIGNLELIGEGDLPASTKGQLVKPALDSALRGAELTQRLLAFSRLQPLQPMPVDLNEMVANMRDLLRRSLGEAIAVETGLSPALWTCQVDPGQFETALVNLAVNSRDAMPSGGCITIETGNISISEGDRGYDDELAPGDYVVLSVSDNGVGMSEAVRNRVFEPFFTTKEFGKGSGLGLSMVYGFIKQTGGQVTIYSEPDVGTTVRLYLPRAAGKSATPDADGRNADILILRRDATILLVEDQGEVRAMAKRLLTDLGFAVVEAADAAAALAELERHPEIDLLLTDIVLPGGVNGQALAAEAIRRNPRLKVLYSSGFTEAALVDQGRLAPGTHLLSKPYRKRDLIRLLNLAASPPRD
ncbi:MAG TPA: PAS domain S-box protein [Candidatus Sulfotelmatobacter sp.]|nr:PAS domain S-box protein [Candidatus Sulfotelmatobacter sp.]